ncbi:tRNA 2-selenouridine(34) synthase MnmH [Hymenobacter sp. DG25A]|uniref:tRNA 2-selenouridine(34) synthase MnmH n=1 Tax=Hymenobacter sp. DG25A TaxID=1385663 RepID=UPI0006BC75C9|nr:tRNA 2-selenouridine(34) synthase MnmH [Hymenobacter sp. DG25A]ALD21884.1 tRNA 2-selenouridine synthase [Hymenobacter sp. DG25A]
MPRIQLTDFLSGPTHAPILDVRAPLEYAHGHIPGALNLPLFSNEERARIGTIYKQVSQEKAVLQGLDFFGPNMSSMVKQAQKLAPNKEVRLHCWRGGMRSGAVQWLLELAGFRVHLLDKGYKDYRRWVLEQFSQHLPLLVLGGLTGSGKTDVLQVLAHRGETIIDLEGLARHKGSSFGGIGMEAQPTPEQFENDLARALSLTPLDNLIWVEDESLMIGAVHLPKPLYEQMHRAPLILLEVPRPMRTRKLAEEYCQADPELLKAAIQRISKRLGGLATQEALAAIDAGDMEKMVDIALTYYDKAYRYALAARTGTQLIQVPSETCDPVENAGRVMAALRREGISNLPATMSLPDTDVA